jgi:hypothetical protein
MTSETTKIATLSSGCRGLLVAMICHGTCETFAAKGCSSGESGPVPMNKSQIRSSFTTMIAVKKQTPGGIEIGHDVNEMSVMNWISELHDCGLIRRGASSARGVRAFTGGKGDMVYLNAAILYLIVAYFCFLLCRSFLRISVKKLILFYL